MKKEYIVAMAILVLAVALYLTPVSSVIKDTSNSIEYDSMVCIYKNGEEVQCKPNLVTNGGLNFIKDCIGQGLCGTPTNFSIIALGNLSGGSQAATDTTLANEWTTCGLTRSPGVYTSIGNGNWSVSKVWTATGSCLVNTTALFNATSSGTMFALNNFTTVSLATNDQINVTWTIWVQ